MGASEDTDPIGRVGKRNDGPAQHEHPVRGRFNSWFLDLASGDAHRKLGAVRQQVLSNLSGSVVDVGAGNGPMLRYLRPGVTVHAVEPNPYFHRRLRRTAQELGIELVLHTEPGERIDLPDNSVDAAMTSWVLCTVADPAAVLSEVRRVLKPGGRFAFTEHVGAPAGSAVRRVQNLVFRPWRWLFEGCHTNRDIADVIFAAGFSSVELRDVVMATPFVPMRSQIAGVATR
jgi:ubiquinone/menaquinone biosynthesis C-methylase UbiE